VRRTALYLQSQEGGNTELIELAALLHDYSDHKYNGGDFEAGAKEVLNLLLSLGADAHLAQQVAQIEMTPAKEAAKAKRASIIASGQGLKEATSLRKEFEGLPEVKDFRQLQSSYEKIKTVTKKPSPAGDISLVFSYMKMLDPSSTVREGEYATAKNAAGVPDIIRNQYNKLKSGEFLSEKQRTDFLQQATNLYNAQQSLVAKREQDFSALSSAYGTSASNVLPRKTEQAPKVLSAKDEQALAWAKKNSSDPRAKLILQKLGGK
jgi:hypothetical protein